MKTSVKVVIGIIFGMVAGFCTLILPSMWGMEDAFPEWSAVLMVTIPTITGVIAGGLCDREKTFSVCLYSFGIALLAALVVEIIFFLAIGIGLVVHMVANMTFGDWALLAILGGIVGGPTIYVIAIFFE